MIKKAILTGGGHATRLRPITTTINKHLIPLANKPMIFHAIEKAVGIGVKEIFINVNPGETELQKYVGDGGHWGIAIKYFEQTGGPQGIAHVVSLARDFVEDDPFIFYLSDNIVFGSLKPLAEKFAQENLNCLLSFARVPDPERFGVGEFDAVGKLLRVLEKPVNPPSDLAQTGIYFYDKTFFEAFKHIQKGARGEYEISDINTWLLQNGYKVGWSEVTGYWKDSGKPNDLLIANQLLLDDLPAGHFTNNAVIEKGARIEGNVKIGHGTKIGPKVLIRGPVIIGENCVLEDCYIGPYTTISQGTEIYSAEVEHAIIFENVDINCSIRIVDSIIGKNASIVSGHAAPPAGHKMILGDNTFIEI
ncbi:MAG: glucose-1-phosphate thymidylyltransferase [Candidatus Magasanikbacteria bacterium]|nr:glucose-1-phosphate thymidylyltransferase [Candidatus Magasanikbacteria bacterium]